jgi:hypothetical protein
MTRRLAHQHRHAAPAPRRRRGRQRFLLAAATTVAVLAAGVPAYAAGGGATHPDRAQRGPKPTTSPTPTTTSSSPGDLPGWQLEFDEDFTTNVAEGGFLAAYPDFTAYPRPWHDTSGRGVYDPSILSVSNGALNIHLHTNAAGEHLVAAPEPLVNNGARDQLYGRYEMRFRADQLPGYKTAWLLWPQSDVWSDGEIDFPEGDLTGTIKAFNHHAGDPSKQEAFDTGQTYSAWHDAVTEWSPGKVSFFLDGRLVGTSTTSVMSTPAHFVLQSETAVDPSVPVPSTSDGDIQLDYFRAWRYVG